MLSTANRCPVCLVPKRGGRRCAYHATQRARGLSDDFIRESVAKTLERNQVIQILCEAVDDARQRTEYHRRYYQANKTKRREQRLNSKRKRKVLNIHAHLIKQLCHAVDIGRQTASW
jgi:hypothetical protein